MITDSSGCYAGALILLNKLSNSPLEVKLEAARKVLTVVFMRPNAPVMFAKQVKVFNFRFKLIGIINVCQFYIWCVNLKWNRCILNS